jgi:hypothetical protein
VTATANVVGLRRFRRLWLLPAVAHATIRTVAKINFGLRLEPDTIAELETLALLMTSRAGGAKVSSHEAARAALARGIAALRAELGDATTDKKPGRKPAK